MGAARPRGGDGRLERLPTGVPYRPERYVLRLTVSMDDFTRVTCELLPGYRPMQQATAGPVVSDPGRIEGMGERRAVVV